MVRSCQNGVLPCLICLSYWHEETNNPLLSSECIAKTDEFLQIRKYFNKSYSLVLVGNQVSPLGQSEQKIGWEHTLFEPRHEKSGFLHMRKQSCRSAVR